MKYLIGLLVGFCLALAVPAMADVIGYTALGEARDALARVQAMENLFRLDCTKTKEWKENKGTWREVTHVQNYCVKRP